jgi:hypothetical protein
MFYVLCLQSGVHQQSARPITKRVAELPSLRYGTVGAKTTGTGPLRVNTWHHNDVVIVPNKKKSCNQSKSSNESKSCRPVSIDKLTKKGI